MAVTNEISKAFSKHAPTYEDVAKIQQEIGLRLLHRLEYCNITPKRILDLGCGPGTFSRQLAQLYPKAEVVGLDLSHAMLLEAKKKYSWRRTWPLVTADMCAMPFPNDSFDLIFANQVVHWAHSQERVFRELNRVMQVNGCLMFSTLGPDTFQELRCFGLNVHAHANEFIDMHDVGDALLGEHFLDPVMDMEWLTVHYRSFMHVMQSLKQQGVRNINPSRNRGLTGKQSWQHFEKSYASLKTAEDKYPLTYEVVYGHAWKGEKRNTERGTETVIPIERIIRK